MSHRPKKIFEPRLCVECLDHWFIPIRENNVTCSRACSKHRDQRKLNAKRNPRPLTKICKECGKTFIPSRVDQPTCSEHCQDIRTRRLKAEQQAHRPPGRENPPSKEEEHEEIDRLRAFWGMRPLRRGTSTCHRCRQPYESDDLDRETRCESCRNRISINPEIGSPHTGGLSIQERYTEGESRSVF